ncbi:uncharacterized protein LOC135200071 [Macrobrachium nipponense]|uniref:uncharacterized protein LOC135200071 n=1 Tax=Macrobrachium nipponense TaxID=159736 RepID=UPI0030C7C69E
MCDQEYTPFVRIMPKNDPRSHLKKKAPSCGESYGMWRPSYFRDSRDDSCDSNMAAESSLLPVQGTTSVDIRLPWEELVVSIHRNGKNGIPGGLWGLQLQIKDALLTMAPHLLYITE